MIKRLVFILVFTKILPRKCLQGPHGHGIHGWKPRPKGPADAKPSKLQKVTASCGISPEGVASVSLRAAR
jgi:hypothetical protein